MHMLAERNDQETASASMCALRVTEWGDLSNVRLEQVERPTPAPGEVLVRMAHSGVNFMDVYTVRGAYKESRTYPLRLPLTLGMEGAGYVEALGDGVDGFQPGELVSFCLHWGAHADWTAVPAEKLARVPESVGSDVAAAVTFQGVTAHYLAHDMAHLRAGDWAFVLSGSGGIAQLLTQMLRQQRVRVVATASSGEKAEVARRAGAELVLPSDDPDVAAHVRDVTGGGAAVVYDSSGQSTIASSMQCLRRRGTLVLVGTNSGPVKTLDVPALMEAGSISFVRPRLADFIATSAEFRSRLGEVFGMVTAGLLDAAPASTFSLAQGRIPMQQLESRTAIGKSVLSRFKEEVR